MTGTGRRKFCASRTSRRPVPADDEVLVKVHATTVTRTDCDFRARRAVLLALLHRPPPAEGRIPGWSSPERSRRSARRSPSSTVGDEVFGIRGGAHAEYICVREQGALAMKPAGISLEEAAAVCDGGILGLRA